MPNDRIRVLRVIEYSGPRDKVEAHLAQCTHGTRAWPANRADGKWSEGGPVVMNSQIVSITNGDSGLFQEEAHYYTLASRMAEYVERSFPDTSEQMSEKDALLGQWMKAGIGRRNVEQAPIVDRRPTFADDERIALCKGAINSLLDFVETVPGMRNRLRGPLSDILHLLTTGEDIFPLTYEGPHRWEVGFRNIVAMLFGVDKQFSIAGIVELVRSREEARREIQNEIACADDLLHKIRETYQSIGVPDPVNQMDAIFRNIVRLLSTSTLPESTENKGETLS